MTLDLLARLAAFFHAKVAALLARQGEIRRQASHVKQSLEAMTIGGGGILTLGLILSVFRDRLLTLPERIHRREGMFRVLNWR